MTTICRSYIERCKTVASHKDLLGPIAEMLKKLEEL